MAFKEYICFVDLKILFPKTLKVLNAITWGNMHCLLKSQLWRWLWFSRNARHREDLMFIEFTFNEAIKALKLLFAYVNCELVSMEVLPANWFFLLWECNIWFLLLKRRRHDGFQLEGETFLWEWTRLIFLLQDFSLLLISISSASRMYAGLTVLSVWKWDSLGVLGFGQALLKILWQALLFTVFQVGAFSILLSLATAFKCLN